jgi:3-methyl-2-oxobutanoate hydroxymethyltransferase
MKNKIINFIKKKNKSKIICLTAYSKNVASIIDRHCDLVLVGDSLGSVLYNFSSTKKVTLDMMIDHSKSVRVGVTQSLMVVDMPYNTYRNPKEALKNAKKIMLKTKCDAVKIEGGKKVTQIIKNLIKNKIPVMGHLGVMPQSATSFKFKGKNKAERKNILRDSKILEEAGVFSIVLECVESTLAKEITKMISIPTIGIGASAHCDGQVLVTDDLIGLNKIKARFVKRYLNIEKQINDAVLKFKKDVTKVKFPRKKHSY